MDSTMTPPTRLAGFKIMKEMLWSFLFEGPEEGEDEREFCHLMAEKQLNLPYLTVGIQDKGWGLNFAVDAQNAQRFASIVENCYSRRIAPAVNAAILSIFPHRNNPEVIGLLLEALSYGGIEPLSLANSPSAISVVLAEEIVNKAATALFGSFSFSAYRTPSDWKLAQKGKENLYKEVVASYQEKKPKVYGLEWKDKEMLVKIDLTEHDLDHLAPAFKDYAIQGFQIPFLISGPLPQQEKKSLFFCLPESAENGLGENLSSLVPQATITYHSPVAFFSMNGPHFGDRYAIASELLKTLDQANVKLFGLSCSIASIIGVVAESQIQPAMDAIQGSFEVPTITRKD